jgi:putative nucleotidyltransferase with HDIG domain
MVDERATGNVWRARPVIATVLRLTIMLIPIGVSLAVTATLRHLVPAPSGTWRVAWVAGLLGSAVLAAIGVERVARRLLPLVTLLKLSMLFPDLAPSRFSIARTAGSVRKLEARLEEAENDPEAREESRTAATILSLSVALQSHDRHTRGHAERVRVFTDLLGEELQLPEADRYRLRWAALLHDIGKLRIAARILNKPGALNDAEWRVMKGHPTDGARIAEPILAWLGPWGDAIEEHHERFDGKGYPAGLRGGDISQAGRIVAVADCYDTMTSARSYKKPMAVWTARRELADCAGGQFDPEMVRAFLSISLPRLLWRTGPVSFLVQLPFLGRLREVGLQSVTAMTDGVAAAAVAAGVTAMVVAGPAASAHGHPGGGSVSRTTGPIAVMTPSPDGSTPETGGTPPSPRPPGDPSPMPTPSGNPGDPPGDPDPTDAPTPDPNPVPSLPTPVPSPTSSPLPLPSPTLPPLPLPSPTLPPLSLPSPTLPPLPLPTLPTLPVPVTFDAD